MSAPGAPTAGGGSAVPSARPWRDRLDDPDEPLYTVAVAAELLGLDPQSLRRLGVAVERESARPSGNQRRYSRNDLELLAAAAALAEQGYPPVAIARVLDLERQLDLAAGRDGTEHVPSS